jgi:hypothetical protein
MHASRYMKYSLQINPQYQIRCKHIFSISKQQNAIIDAKNLSF